MKNLSKLVASFALASIVGAILVPILPSASNATEECKPAVLMLRGSNESQSSLQVYKNSSNEIVARTNGWEGPTLSRIVLRAAESDKLEEVTPELRFVGVDYEARDVLPTAIPFPDLSGVPLSQQEFMKTAWAVSQGVEVSSHLTRYMDSISEGAKNAVDFINADMQRGCDTQYLLVGYSQGALSSRVAANMMGNNTDKIVGTYLVGDPMHGADGLTSARSVSVASSGNDRDSYLRAGLDTLTSMNAPLVSNTDGMSYLKLVNRALTRSDATAHRDDSTEDIYSRALCHEGDPVCWSPDWGISADIEQHTNYYKATEDSILGPGDLDRAVEPTAFANQLQALVDESVSLQSKNRALEKTLSVTGKSTVYNVSNLRQGDMCKWDAESDGVFESTLIPCGTYEHSHLGADAKMTVVVKDAHDFERTYSTSEKVVEPEKIAELGEVPYDRWLQFRSKSEPVKCLDFPQRWTFPGTREHAGAVRAYDCLDSPSRNFSMNAAQVWMRKQAPAGQGYFRWGYDDDFAVYTTTGGGPDSPVWVVGKLSHSTEDPTDTTTRGLRTELVRIEDGAPYFQLKLQWGSESGCVSQSKTGYDTWENMHWGWLDVCDISDETQLFTYVLAPSNEEYGNFNIAKDSIKPTDIETINVEVDTVGKKTTISWSESIDNRHDSVNYQVQKFHTSWDATGTWYHIAYTDTPVVTAFATYVYPTDKYRVRSFDANWNYSAWLESKTVAEYIQ